MSGTRAACDGERAGRGERQISQSAVKLGWQEGEMDGGAESKTQTGFIACLGSFYLFIYLLLVFFYSDRNAHE